jgi:hypothetical protein
MTRVRIKAIMVAITNAHKLQTNNNFKSELHERNYSTQFLWALFQSICKHYTFCPHLQ